MAEQKQDTGQVNFEEIQTRLDNKLIDPRQLNRAQRGALDLAFKDGKLKGYSSVSEMDAERQFARTEIAKEFKEKLAPLTPTSALSLGIRRSTLVAAGDILGSFAPYIMDGKKLAAESRELALKGKGVSYIPEIQRTTGKNTFTAVSNLLTKLPVLKNLKLFQGTAKVLDGFVDTIGAGSTAKLVASQALKTELKSQALGAAGAGAGSITYDVINFPAKFVAGANEDMAKIDQNQFNKMSPLEKTTYHAIDNARLALMWNAGAFGLFSVARGLGQGAKKFFKLNPEHQKIANQLINEQGLPISPIMLAEGTGGASQLFKNLNRIISVLPAGAGEPLAYQQKFTAAALLGLQSNLKQSLSVPLLHTEVLANAVNATIKDTYVKSGEIYGNLYKQSDLQYNEVANVMDKYMNKIIDKQRNIDLSKNLPAQSDVDYIRAVFPEGTEIPFVYSKNLRDTTDRIIKNISKGTSKTTTDRLQATNLRSSDLDPLNLSIKEIQARLDEFKLANGGDYLTPNQFFKLRQDWNKNYIRTFEKSSEEVQGKAFQILRAFEADLNGVVKSPNANALMETNPKLFKMFNFVKENLGEKEAQNFFYDFQTKLKDGNQFFANANSIFSQSVNFYHYSTMANIARKMDSSELTVKQTLNIEGGGNLSDVQGMNALFKAGFNPNIGTSEKVKQLYELLGGAKYFPKQVQERAQYTMGLLMYRTFFDAFNKNAVIRKAGGTRAGEEVGEPFFTKGANMTDVIRILDEQSPSFRKTVEEIIQIKNPSGVPSDMFIDKIKYQKKAITVDTIRRAIKEDLPIAQEIFIKKEVDTLGARAKPLTEDVVSITEKARQATVGGRIVPKSERIKSGFLGDKPSGAAAQLEELQLRLSGYQEFKFDKFANDIGITTQSGREQLVEGFKIAKGLSSEAAQKHVNNIEIILEGLKRNSLSPPGDSSTFIVRSIILGLGLGGGAAGVLLLGGGAGGLLGLALSAIIIKAGARFFNSPKYAAKWVDLYSTGQRLDENAKKALQPSRQSVFADIFNYAFEDDPDAPKISPGNIKEKDVINYLQNMDTVQSVPTAAGLYEAVPNEVKERFNPDLKRLKELSAVEKFDITNYDRGLKVANTRTDILDGLASQQNVRTIPPELQGFLENPSAVDVPEGVQQAAANIPAQTQAVYDALFPQDKLGSAIAGTQNA
jgi:hypothetical protein